MSVIGLGVAPVTEENWMALVGFDTVVMDILDADNPFYASFRDDVKHIEDALCGRDDRSYFLFGDSDNEHDDKVTNVARCGIKWNPPADDIYAYGDVAARIFDEKADVMASLICDIVHPDYRGQGLQRSMIEFRLNILAQRGYGYAVAGIAEGNVHSRNNYVRAGFEPIGNKDITWKTPSGDVTSNVELLGLDIQR